MRLVAGKQGGQRAFLAHKCVLACRCPRLLAMLAFGSSRFVRGGGGGEAAQQQQAEEAPPPLHWPSQAAAAAVDGALPILQGLIECNSPLKQFALPIMCDIARAPSSSSTTACSST